MFQSIYDLILSTIFNGVVITGWIEMVCTVLATAICVFAFLIPFIVVWKVICLIVGR